MTVRHERRETLPGIESLLDVSQSLFFVCGASFSGEETGRRSFFYFASILSSLYTEEELEPSEN